MSRSKLNRAAFLCVALMMAFSMLVACGGDDDSDGDSNSGGGSSTDFPVPSDADKLGEEEVSAEDVGTEDIEISDAKAVAYKVSDTEFDAVADFYETEVEDKGWTVDEHVALGELMIAVLHKDDRLILATAMTATAAREQGAAELGDLTIDLDALEDDDIVIIAASFTCNEDSVDTCITAMDLGL